jgi:hypothetical protein
MKDLTQFNLINASALFGGITLANVEMVLGIIVLISALVYNIIKINKELNKKN